jgi:predicted site-specific integrase-resolvase
MNTDQDFFKETLVGEETMIKYYTVEEVAEYFCRDIRTIYRWIGTGFIKKYTKVIDGYRIPEDEIARIADMRNDTIPKN